MKPRSCRDLAETRSAYVDGHLSEAERQALLRHLSDCAACRQDLADLRRLRSLLSPAGRPGSAEVPAALAARLTAIAEAGADPAARRPIWLGPAAGVVVCCLLAAVGYLVAPPRRDRIADPSTAVRADTATILAQLPLTGAAVAAALLVDPSRLRTDRSRLSADPTMTGTRLDPARTAALMRRADRATDAVAYTGLERVVAPRDVGGTAADVAIAMRPGTGAGVEIRNLTGAVVARGSVPAPASTAVTATALRQTLTSAYRLSAVDGGTLLGRSVTMVQARRPGTTPADAPAARWWIDDGTGLVLRQQTYDPTGRLVLAAGFTRIRFGAEPATATAAVGATAGRPLTAPVTTAAFTPSTAGRLARQGWFCHAELAGLALTRLRADAPAEPEVVHMVYTDGLSTVSVFERRGALAGPPTGSQWDPTLAAYRTDAMLNTATWQSGGVVFTVATDGPTAARDAVVAALPHRAPSTRSTMARIRAGWGRLLTGLGDG